MLNAQLYDSSFHAAIFEAIDAPACQTCHGNHGIAHPTDAMLAAGDSSACGQCHLQQPDDPGFALGLAMKAVLDSLEEGYDTTVALVESGRLKGMYTSELELALREVHQGLVQSRTQIHSFDEGQVARTAGPGLELAAGLEVRARALLAEYDQRRWWLGGSTLLLVFLIGVLFLKLRQVERPRS